MFIRLIFIGALLFSVTTANAQRDSEYLLNLQTSTIGKNQNWSIGIDYFMEIGSRYTLDYSFHAGRRAGVGGCICMHHFHP